MSKKCLIINGSPKLNGNTFYLINEFIKNFNYEIEIVNAFPFGANKGISSCRDCGGCAKRKFCSINDDFSKIVKDDYDCVIIAAPIYQSNLPGPMINLMNRFNFTFNNKISLNFVHEFQNKLAGLILVGGGGACKSVQGNSNEDLPIRQAKYIFKKLNASLHEQNIVLCLNTDDVRVKGNIEVKQAVARLANNLNHYLSTNCDAQYNTQI